MDVCKMDKVKDFTKCVSSGRSSGCFVDAIMKDRDCTRDAMDKIERNNNERMFDFGRSSVRDKDAYDRDHKGSSSGSMSELEKYSVTNKTGVVVLDVIRLPGGHPEPKPLLDTSYSIKPDVINTGTVGYDKTIKGIRKCAQVSHAQTGDYNVEGCTKAWNNPDGFRDPNLYKPEDQENAVDDCIDFEEHMHGTHNPKRCAKAWSDPPVKDVIDFMNANIEAKAKEEAEEKAEIEAAKEALEREISSKMCIHIAKSSFGTSNVTRCIANWENNKVRKAEREHDAKSGVTGKTVDYEKYSNKDGLITKKNMSRFIKDNNL